MKDGLSIRETTAALGTTKDVVFAALKEAGLERRPIVQAARLSCMNQERLFALIADKSVPRAVAG